MSSESGFLMHDQVQVYDSELRLMELSDVEHLQQLQANVELEAECPEDPPHPSVVVVRAGSPAAFLPTAGVSPSQLTELQCLVKAAEEATQPYWGEVADVGLARGVDAASAASSSGSTARVRLVKRFLRTAGTSSQQETWSVVPSE